VKNKIKELELLKEVSFDEKFIIKYTYDSNAIDGSTLSFEETKKVLKDNIPTTSKPLNYHLSAIAHREACYYVNNLVRKKHDIKVCEILNIYKYVLMKKDIEKEDIIRNNLEKFLGWYKKIKNISLIEKISLFYLEFITIKPFDEGNGRIGRLITNLELMRNGYLPINIKYSDKEKHDNAIKRYEEEKDYSLMVNIIYSYLQGN